MSDVVVGCAGLGKQYVLGERQPYRTLRDSMNRVAERAVRRVVGRSATNGAAAEGRAIWALRDVSLEIRRGDIVGIIGRNGAGKSTLLKLLARVTEPTEGSAVVRGRIGSLLEVGTGFHPELTGRENVYFNGVILGMRKAEIDARFDEIVAFAGVERFIDTPVKHYSSGMQLRLAFAVAAHLDTEILLVDEVLAVGDMEFQRRCIGKMGDISRSGRTVLFVSHNMASVGLLCQRGIVLESGRTTFDGTIADAIGRYMHSIRQLSGETSWQSPETAPGNERARLKAVRVVADGVARGDVDIGHAFDIEVHHWNLEMGGARVVSIHVYNDEGVCVFTSANFPGASLEPDPWWGRGYPIGLFKTVCSVPGGLLNDGAHSVSVYINGSPLQTDNLVVVRDVLSFEVRDSGGMRSEYSGRWLGAIRPRLGWSTVQIG